MVTSSLWFTWNGPHFEKLKVDPVLLPSMLGVALTPHHGSFVLQQTGVIIETHNGSKCRLLTIGCPALVLKHSGSWLLTRHPELLQLTATHHVR